MSRASTSKFLVYLNFPKQHLFFLSGGQTHFPLSKLPCANVPSFPLEVIYDKITENNIR